MEKQNCKKWISKYWGVYFWSSLIDVSWPFNSTLIVIYHISVWYRNLTCFDRWQLYIYLNLTCRNGASAAGFNPIKTWQQRASLPLKPAQGHRLQVKIPLLMFTEKWQNYSKYHKIRSFITPDRRQSRAVWAIDERGSKIARNSVFDWHLPPGGQQTAIKKSDSNDLWSTFVDSIYVFDCRLSGVVSLSSVVILCQTACAWKEGK